jgi:hypothetical protein
MTEKLDENWQPIGTALCRAFEKMAADIEEKHRRQFDKDCAQDGIKRPQPERAA